MEVAQKQLGKPVKLRYDDPPPEIDDLMPARNEPVFVEVLFTVAADGTVEDAVVVESNASNGVKRQVRLAVQQARYRPGFEDGKPTPMQVRIRQKYYSAPPATTTAKAPEATKEEKAKIPSEANTPGEAGDATKTGSGVPPPSAAPATTEETGEAGTDARTDNGPGGDASAPAASQSPQGTGTTGADAAAESATPPAEPEPETP
jgi:TonB family protein